MGLCQSREAVPGGETTLGVAKSEKSTKLKVNTFSSQAEAGDPLTARTDTMESPPSRSVPSFQQAMKLANQQQEDEGVEVGPAMFNFVPSLRHTEEIDDLSLISEEADPDAPSDEEDHVQAAMAKRASRSSSAITTTRKAGVSPPRPQTRIKLRHEKVTRPDSVIHHEQTLKSASSIGSVDLHTISQFRKLKVQVKLAAKQERRRRRAAKLEDRYGDVQGYKQLWKSFEEIQDVVVKSVPSSPKRKSKKSRRKRQDSFDLKDTKTWFFDFQALDDQDPEAYLDDDELSQSSWSLHSTASFESQKRYFAEKRESRRDYLTRGHSDSQLVSSKYDDKFPTLRVFDRVPSDLSNSSCMYMGTPTKSYTSDNENRDDTGSPTLSVEQRRDCESPEYHIYKSVLQDEETPLPSDEDVDDDDKNDYRVARRRRLPSGDGIFRADAKENMVISPPPSRAKGFYSSESIEVVASERAADLDVMRISPDSNTVKEQVIMGNADKCLQGASGGKSAEDSTNVSIMSTEEFQSLSAVNFMVKMSQRKREASPQDAPKRLDSPKRLDFDTEAAEQVSKEVTELLARFRKDEDVPDDETEAHIRHTTPTKEAPLPVALSLEPPL